MTDTYAIGGPRGRDLRTAFGPLTASICGGLAFDSRGRIVAVCPSLIAPPKLRLIDPDSLELLAEYVMPDASDAAGHARRSRTSPAAATSSWTTRTGSGARRRPTGCSS